MFCKNHIRKVGKLKHTWVLLTQQKEPSKTIRSGKKLKIVLLGHASTYYNPHNQKLRQEDCSKFEAGIGYIGRTLSQSINYGPNYKHTATKINNLNFFWAHSKLRVVLGKLSLMGGLFLWPQIWSHWLLQIPLHIPTFAMCSLVSRSETTPCSNKYEQNKVSLPKKKRARTWETCVADKASHNR